MMQATKPQTKKAIADALDPVRRRIDQWIGEGASDGRDFYALARLVEQTFPEQAEMIQDAALVSWCETAAPKSRTEDGLPKNGTFNGKAIQIAFWTVDQYRVQIEHHVQPARANLDIAHRLAEECQRRHGVVIEVPNLVGDLAEASATG